MFIILLEGKKMAFDEVQFPADISYGSSGGPIYSTDIVATASGHEKRNANWSEGLAKYNVAHGVKDKTQLAALIAFFRARKGKASGFRFKDWSDYSVTGQSIGIGNGMQTAFQLIKSYTSGSVTEIRNITKPVTGTIKIYKNAVLQSSGVTTNTTNGIVTFTVAPAIGISITADFEFDVPVRFDTDSLEARFDYFGVYSWNSIPLVEVRTD